MDGLLTFQLTKNTLFHVVQCLNQTNNPKITLYFQEHGSSSSRASVISVTIWWNFDVSFLLWLTWCCGPVDGQGWFCPLPQSEWARRGLLLLLPDRAGGLGAGRQSLVRKRPHFAQDFISSVILFEGYICRRFCRLHSINLKIVLQLFIAFSRSEHVKRFPNCGFLTMKKDFTELTVGEFYLMEQERLKIFHVSDTCADCATKLSCCFVHKCTLIFLRERSATWRWRLCVIS